jgi:hypothetical protein
VNAAVTEGTPAASIVERATDSAYHSILRFRDRVVPYAYSLVPVSLWKKYRQAKYRALQIDPPNLLDEAKSESET